MPSYVQRRPTVTAVRYIPGDVNSAQEVTETFPFPPDEALQEFRIMGMPDDEIQEKAQYMWEVIPAGYTLERPAVLADGTQVDPGYVTTATQLWFGMEEQGIGTGITLYRQVPDGYVSSGWALAPNMTAKADFEKDWEPVSPQS